MSSIVQRLAARSLGLGNYVRPRTPGLFESPPAIEPALPVPPVEGMAPSQDQPSSNQPGLGQEVEAIARSSTADRGSSLSPTRPPRSASAPPIGEKPLEAVQQAVPTGPFSPPASSTQSITESSKPPTSEALPKAPQPEGGGGSRPRLATRLPQASPFSRPIGEAAKGPPARPPAAPPMSARSSERTPGAKAESRPQMDYAPAPLPTGGRRGAQSPEPPSIEITIGRIDIRAERPAAPPQAPSRRQPRHSLISLEDYMAGERKGRR